MSDSAARCAGARERAPAAVAILLDGPAEDAALPCAERPVVRLALPRAPDKA